jgi:hypothetical protein
MLLEAATLQHPREVLRTATSANLRLKTVPCHWPEWKLDVHWQGPWMLCMQAKKSGGSGVMTGIILVNGYQNVGCGRDWFCVQNAEFLLRVIFGLLDNPNYQPLHTSP